MRRSILSSVSVLALCIALVVPLSPSPVGADEGFADVPGDHPFATEISWAVARGITSGFPNGDFRPTQAVSRQAAAAFLYRLAGQPAVSGTAGFVDVPVGHPFETEIAWMVREGLTSGFPNGEFRPTQPVSRQAAAAFLYRYQGEPAVTGGAGFPDVPSGHPFETEIAWMVGGRITSGFPNGTFRPGNEVTRQAMAAFLYRSMGLEGYPEVTAQTISTGRTHTCAVEDSGQVWCWGDNRVAQAGIDVGFEAVPSPHRIDAVSDAVDISAHSTMSCAVRRTGGVACWGNNQYGLLGGGFDSPGGRVIPVEVVGISDAVAVRGDAYGSPAVLSCVQHANGGASCWGINADYGDGIRYQDREWTVPLTPVRSQLRDALEISVGNGHVCGRHTDGGVSCWGSNSSYQSGDPSWPGHLTLPERTTGIGDVIEIEAGSGTTCARTGDGGVSCWGRNAYGQVGNGVTSSPVTTPYRVSALTGAQQVSIGWQHACALLPDGAVSCWGYNERGQLGDGTDVARYTPTRVVGITDAVEVSVGLWHSCARLADGRVLCWGDNNYGQLGNGERVSSLTPVQVAHINLGSR